MENLTDIFGMLIGFGLVVVVPLVAILLGHQRKMTEMIHRRGGDENLVREVERLRDELMTLRTEVHRQVITTEELVDRLAMLPRGPEPSRVTRTDGSPVGVENQ